SQMINNGEFTQSDAILVANLAATLIHNNIRVQDFEPGNIEIRQIPSNPAQKEAILLDAGEAPIASSETPESLAASYQSKIEHPDWWQGAIEPSMFKSLVKSKGA